MWGDRREPTQLFQQIFYFLVAIVTLPNSQGSFKEATPTTNLTPPPPPFFLLLWSLLFGPLISQRHIYNPLIPLPPIYMF